MHKTIISDTSCLIVLSKIGELELLHGVYSHIITTIEVAAEFGEKLPAWLGIEHVKDKYRQQLLEMQIDKGEASALALALETPGSVVIVDDYKARKIAEKLSISFTGTIGVIIKAKKDGYIQSIKPLLKKIKQTDFRISDDVEQQALQAAGESITE